MKYFLNTLILLCLVTTIRSENFLADGSICDDIEVRIGLSELKKLEGCRVVEGSVKILQLGQLTEKDSEEISFPLLTEITGFLMISEVSGLNSVAQLFPNLVRIHGNELFSGYALLLVDNPDLENVGLSNLKEIKKGAVRIERNEMLCYVNTVVWGSIVSDDQINKTFIQNNLTPELCPGCGTSKNCWSQSSPQLQCQCGGSSCRPDGICCTTNCLSCINEDPKVCSVCRKKIVGNIPIQKCVDSCPYRTFEFMGYRCLTAEECKNLNVNKTSDPPFIPFKTSGKCQEGCPQDYQVKFTVEGNKMSASCIPCVNSACWRRCKAPVIDSVKAAQSLKGCQYIEGPLDIQIKGQPCRNLMEDLEDAMADIIEIEDYLKVSRSTPIRSLKMFKNLKTIRGTRLNQNNHSLILLDNPNIEDLFDDDQHVEVLNGKLFVHFNPKLCFDKVERFIRNGAQMIDNFQRAKLSNGDKAYCNATELKVTLSEITSNEVSLQWEALKLDDSQSLLGYAVYYLEVSEEHDDSNDDGTCLGTCRNDDWSVDDVSNQTNPDGLISHTLNNLKSFTKYAIYVKTYSLATEKSGAQSGIKQFKTLPGTPEKVQRFKSVAKSSSEIYLSWKPPANVNGELEKYEINVRKLDIMKDFINMRDFCEETFHSHEIQHVMGDDLLKNSDDLDEESDDFDDILHSFVWNRQKRSPGIESMQKGAENTTESVLPDKNDFLLGNLDHFSSYLVSIRACRKAVNENSGVCSKDVQVIAKSLRSENSDEIETFEVSKLLTNDTDNEVKIIWQPPTNPNGIILNYVVKQVKVNENPPEEELICISLYKRQNLSSQNIDKLRPGNYSFQIAAMSMAGQGNLTSPKYVYIASPSLFSLIATPPMLMLLFLVIASIAGVFLYTVYKRNQVPEHVSSFETFDSEHHLVNR